MTPQLCTFTQSKALKALGYSWETKAGYTENEDGTHKEWYDLNWHLNSISIYPYKDDYLAPSVEYAIRWFRIEKGLHGWVESTFYLEDFSFVALIEQAYKARERIYLIDDKIIYDYDSCESALLNRLIELNSKSHE